MAPIIGHILPLALGVALSSVPIVVMVLILLSPRGRWSGLAYLIGALIGLAGLTVLFTAIASLLPPPPSTDQSPVFGGIELLLGAALLLLAIIRIVRARRARRADTGTPVSPLDELAALDDAPPPGATQRWMDKVTSLGPLPSLGVGFVLMLRPKNLLLTMAAGVAIAAGGEPLTPTTIAIAVFVVLGISTLAAPIIVAVSDPERTRRPLQEIHEWIERNSAVVTTIVLLVLGTVIIGSGLARY
jgi:hypothetical protein